MEKSINGFIFLLSDYYLEMKQTIGIVGGLGTETSCKFCFSVNHKIKNVHQQQPHIIMDNVPMSKELEKVIAHGNASIEVAKLLHGSVKRLNVSMADIIVIPCNTVHVFIDQLREHSRVPIMSIIEETAKECKKKSLKKVGVLGSSLTINSGMYEEELKKHSIKAIIPEEDERNFISSCIIRIINLEQTDEDKRKMIEIVEKMKDKGAEAVILGCTDLFLLLSKENTPIPKIDSTEVFEDALVSRMIN